MRGVPAETVAQLSGAMAKLRRRAWLSAARQVVDPRVAAMALRLTRALAAPRSAAANAERLRAALDHAVTRVPYYRTMFAGVESPALSDFPVLDKHTVRNRFADFIARDERDRLPRGEITVFRTSGSTGFPIAHLKRTRDDVLSSQLLLWRLTSRYGAPRVGHVVDVGLHTPGTPLVGPRVFPGLYVGWNLDRFEPDDPARVAQYLGVMASVDPALVFGSPSRLLQLSRLVAGHEVDWNPSIVVSSYESLTHEARGVIEGTFGAPVVSMYGTCETGLVAFECPVGALHFHDDLVCVEVVDDDGGEVGPGEVGRVVLTPLRARVMPLVRYETGDLAVKSRAKECACGWSGSFVSELVGRHTVHFDTPSGRTVAGYSLMPVVAGLGVPDYQLVQDAEGTRLILPRGHVPGPSFADELARGIASRIGETIPIEIVPSGEFVLSERGKRNPVVRLPLDGQVSARA